MDQKSTRLVLVIISILALAAVGLLVFASGGDRTSPVAILASSRTKVEQGTPIRFSASDSTDNVGVQSYRWDFGDGTTGTGGKILHTFSEVGTYTVALTVIDEAGNKDRETLEIQMYAQRSTDWPTSTPEEQGMDSARLAEMMAFIDQNGIAIDSALVIRHGSIVWEEYRNGYDEQKVHTLQSVTKSFSSVLIGIAIHEGFIEDVNQRLVDFFPDHDIANLDSRKQSITLEHLLTMSPGLDWHEHDYPYSDSRNSLGQMWSSDDAVQHVLDQPMAHEPGAEWAYNSGTSILLGGIIEQATGRDVLSFAWDYLFDPLDVGEVSWAKATGDHYLTDGGLFMTPRDMARLGYLMLQGGTWDGVEIVSPEWVAQSTRAHQYTSWGDGYGYQWWTMPEMGAYAATGHYEQKIYVVPDYDLVAVFTADIADEDPHPADGMLYRFVMAACTDVPREKTHKTYSNYGFSFEYPAGMSVSEEPLPGQDTVSDASGTVQFVFDRYPYKVISVMWETGADGVELEAYIEKSFVELVQQPEIELARGEYFDAHKGEHEMVYQRLSITGQGFEFAGVAGAWRCAERVYAFSYLTSPGTSEQDLSAVFQQYVDGLVCHETR